MGLLGPASVTLKEHGGHSKLFWVETLDLDHIKGFGLVNELFPLRLRSGLERRPKFKLLAVHETQRAGPAVGLRHGSHELDSRLKVVEQKTVEDFALWEGAHSQDGACDDAEVSFASQDKLVHIWPVRDARPDCTLLVRACWCHNSESADDVLDVTVGVLLHT